MKTTKRTILFMILAIAQAWLVTAGAALVIDEEALELDISAVRLPADTSGEIVIRECAAMECETTRLAVDQFTTYHLGFTAGSTTLDGLKRAAAAEDQAIYIFYRAETETVTRIVLTQ